MGLTDEEVLKNFAHSWAETEKHYGQVIDEYEGFHFLVPLFLLIQRMRAAGADRYFRLGTTNRKLTFSRSAEVFLRPDQQFLEIEARENSFIVTLRDLKKMHRQYTIKELDDERLAELLQLIKDGPVG